MRDATKRSRRVRMVRFASMRHSSTPPICRFTPHPARDHHDQNDNPGEDDASRDHGGVAVAAVDENIEKRKHDDEPVSQDIRPSWPRFATLAAHQEVDQGRY